MTRLTLIKIAGATLVVIGVISLALPILPGLFFIAVGGGMLSPRFRDWLRARIVELKRRLKA